MFSLSSIFYVQGSGRLKMNSKKVISFINQKGGVGKTTLLFNTASALAAKDLKILCLDLDPQGNLGLLFNAHNDENKNLFQLLINSIKELKPMHQPLLFTDAIQSFGNIDFIAAGPSLSGFELTVAAIKAPRQLVLSRLFSQYQLKDQYDYILIDCPPTLGLIVINALCGSDGIIAPFKPDDFSMKGLASIYDILEEIEDMGIVTAPEVFLHVPNLVDQRRKQEDEDLQSITNFVTGKNKSGKMLSPIYNKSQLVKSLSQKKSVFDYHSKEYLDLQNAFNEVAKEIDLWSGRK